MRIKSKGFYPRLLIAYVNTSWKKLVFFPDLFLLLISYFICQLYHWSVGIFCDIIYIFYNKKLLSNILVSGSLLRSMNAYLRNVSIKCHPHSKKDIKTHRKQEICRSQTPPLRPVLICPS